MKKIIKNSYEAGNADRDVILSAFEYLKNKR